MRLARSETATRDDDDKVDEWISSAPVFEEKSYKTAGWRLAFTFSLRLLQRDGGGFLRLSGEGGGGKDNSQSGQGEREVELHIAGG